VLWRVRTTLSDRPGALAALTRTCGEQGLNILGLQIFPGLAGVTDELVLRTPDGWTGHAVARLLDDAGGRQVAVSPCTEHALTDGPVHYLHALRRVALDPAALTDVLGRLFDADPRPAAAPAPVSADRDTMVVEIGPQRVVLRRREPFTATEHARATAFAEVAVELLHGEEAPVPAYDPSSGPTPSASQRPVIRLADFHDTSALMRMHLRCSADTVYRRYASPLARVDERFARRLLVSGGGALVATAGEEVVGIASISTCEAGVTEVSILVEDGWQRRGLGTRLLSGAARMARGQGAGEVVLRSRTHNPALMSLAFASGMRARIKLDGDTVVVTVGVDGLKPLTPVPAATPATEEPTPA
jgi:GNAT superfamily N-acetyltransferase